MPTTNLIIDYQQSGKGLRFIRSGADELGDGDALQVSVQPADGTPPARVAALAASNLVMSFDQDAAAPGCWIFSVAPGEIVELKKADSELILSVWLGAARHDLRIKLPPPSSTRLGIPCPPRPDKVAGPSRPNDPRRPGSKPQDERPQGRRLPH